MPSAWRAWLVVDGWSSRASRSGLVVGPGQHHDAVAEQEHVPLARQARQRQPVEAEGREPIGVGRAERVGLEVGPHHPQEVGGGPVEVARDHQAPQS
ncbi:MAG: hypothetical protein WAV00_06765, partial [Nocardioides sp.]